MEKYNSYYPAYLANVKSYPTEILNISFPSEYLSTGVKEKGCLSRPEISEYCFNYNHHLTLAPMHDFYRLFIEIYKNMD